MPVCELVLPGQRLADPSAVWLGIAVTAGSTGDVVRVMTHGPYPPDEYSRVVEATNVGDHPLCQGDIVAVREPGLDPVGGVDPPLAQDPT